MGAKAERRGSGRGWRLGVRRRCPSPLPRRVRTVCWSWRKMAAARALTPLLAPTPAPSTRLGEEGGGEAPRALAQPQTRGLPGSSARVIASPRPLGRQRARAPACPAFSSSPSSCRALYVPREKGALGLSPPFRPGRV